MEQDGARTGGRIRRDEVNVVLVVLLVGMTAVIAWAGLARRPSGAVPPVVPRTLAIDVTTAIPGLGAAGVLTLSRTPDNGAMLVLQNLAAADSAGPASGVTAAQPAWAVTVSGAGSTAPCRYPTQFSEDTGGAAQVRPVTPPVATVPPQVDPGRRSVLYGPRDPTDTFLYLELCWRSGGPVDLDGQYLGAQLPPVTWTTSVPVTAPVDPSGAASFSESLVPADGDTSVYSIQANPNPTTFTSTGWQWAPAPVTAPGTGIGTTVSFPVVYFSGVNSATAQHDSQNAFLSGILLGLAGGAVLTLVAELAKPFAGWRRRRVGPTAVDGPSPPDGRD